MTASPATEATVAAPSRRRRGVVVVVAVLLVALLALPALALLRVLTTARTDDTARTDAIVVLGAAQFWGRPSPVLTARLDRAEVLYREGVSDRIVTVGGKQPRDNTTEAAAGRDLLVRHGVPASDVVPVPTGRDTLTSLTAVAALMTERGWTSATLVTDPAHEARSVSMARALGIDAHPAPTRSGDGSNLTWEYVARETAALVSFWVLGRRDVESVVGAAPAPAAR